MKFLIMLLSALVFVSCASHHGDTIAVQNEETTKPSIVVSAEVIKELSDKSHSMIVFTFENNSDDWTRYKAAHFSCGDECDLKTNIIIGQDLGTWMKSQYHKRAISRHNNDLLYTGAIILGAAAAVIGSGSNNPGLVAAGATSYGIGAVGALHGIFSDSQLAAKTGKIDPQSDHLYNPFSVPSTGLSKKWILVHTPKKQKIKNINLKLENEGGEVETYNISL